MTGTRATTHPSEPEPVPGPPDEGTVTAFTVILATALLACAGLVLDGGLALAARVQAIGLAQEAARAGSQEIDLTTYRTTGAVVLNPDAASAAARDFISAGGATGTATTTADTVTVTVTQQTRSQLLGLIGIHTFTETATATAAARPAP